MRSLTVLFLASAIAGCTTGWKQSNVELQSTPRADVIDATKSQGQFAAFKSKIKGIEEFSVRNDFGSNTLEAETHIFINNDGISTIKKNTTWGRSPDGKVRGAIQTDETSICGLQLIARESRARALLVNVSVGVSPVSVATNTKDVEVTETERFIADHVSEGAAKLCAPEPSMAFNYTFAGQAQRKQPPRINFLWPLSAKVTCHAAVSKIPAAKLVPGLAGDALEVSCTAKYLEVGDEFSKYAYFEALGGYLPLETSEPQRGKTIYRYVSGELISTEKK